MSNHVYCFNRNFNNDCFREVNIVSDNYFSKKDIGVLPKVHGRNYVTTSLSRINSVNKSDLIKILYSFFVLSKKTSSVTINIKKYLNLLQKFSGDQ